MAYVKQIVCTLEEILGREAGGGPCKYENEVTTGFKSSTSNSTEVSAETSTKVGGAWNAISGEVSAKFGASITSTFTTEFQSTSKFRQTMEAPADGSAWYLYKASTTVTMSDGEVLTFGGSLKSFGAPQDARFTKDFEPTDYEFKCCIKSQHNTFVGVPPGTGGKAMTAEKKQAWETFYASRVGDGYTFKTCHDTYLAAHEDGYLSTSYAVSGWEIFYPGKSADGYFTLRTHHGTYVSIPAQPGKEVTTVNGVNGVCECFNMDGFNI